MRRYFSGVARAPQLRQALLFAPLLAALSLALAVAQAAAPLATDTAVPLERIDILTGRCSSTPQRLRYAVELAADPAARRRGLQQREQLPDDRGMLFLWSGSARRAMWMKDTSIPLDMLFLAADGRILALESAQPRSERIISPPVAALAVLELAGGTAERLGICDGDRVRSKRLRPKASLPALPAPL